MFVRTFSSSCFLRNVFGTHPFLDYCRDRGIALPQAPSSSMHRQDLRQWVAALAKLSPEAQARVERDLPR